MNVQPWKDAHKDVVSRLPRLRLMVNITCHDLSRKSGVSWSSLKRIENGTLAMTINTAMRLCPYLNCTPAYLLFGI